METERKFRPCPCYEGYQVSQDGLVIGPAGKIMRVSLRNEKNPITAFYALKRRGNYSSKKNAWSLVKEAWGIDFTPTREWVDKARAEAETFNRSTIRTAEIVDRECTECGKSFSVISTSERTTCSGDCTRAKRLRTTRNSNGSSYIGEPVTMYSQTGCVEFPTWDCPQMDPFTNRGEYCGVWVDISDDEKRRMAA